MFYPAIVTLDDGAFVVTFPDAPGCVTQGPILPGVGGCGRKNVPTTGVVV